MHSAGAAHVAMGVEVDLAVEIDDERGEQRLELSAVASRHHRRIEVEPEAVVSARPDQVLDVAGGIVRVGEARPAVQWRMVGGPRAQDQVLSLGIGPVGVGRVERAEQPGPMEGGNEHAAVGADRGEEQAVEIGIGVGDRGAAGEGAARVLRRGPDAEPLGIAQETVAREIRVVDELEVVLHLQGRRGIVRIDEMPPACAAKCYRGVGKIDGAVGVEIVVGAPLVAHQAVSAQRGVCSDAVVARVKQQLVEKHAEQQLGVHVGRGLVLRLAREPGRGGFRLGVEDEAEADHGKESQEGDHHQQSHAPAAAWRLRIYRISKHGNLAKPAEAGHYKPNAIEENGPCIVMPDTGSCP